MSPNRSHTDQTRISGRFGIASRPSGCRTTRRRAAPSRVATAAAVARGRVQDGAPLRPRGRRSALCALWLALLGPVGPVCLADEPQTGVAIFQHLIETVPGQFEVRAFSLSAAAGTNATATVTTFTDADGTFQRGVTAAAAGAGVNREAPFRVSAPEGWAVETPVGQSLPSAP